MFDAHTVSPLFSESHVTSIIIHVDTLIDCLFNFIKEKEKAHLIIEFIPAIGAMIKITFVNV